MNDAVQYLSAESLASLKEEYTTLREVTIPEIAKRIDDAKQQGDLSENAEYHQAREDMSWAQGRLQELEEIISNSQIITKKNTSAVQIGSKVIIRGADKREREYTIVGAQEVNPAKGLISNESPIGQALIGREEGESVEVNAPSGKVSYKIVKVQQ